MRTPQVQWSLLALTIGLFVVAATNPGTIAGQPVAVISVSESTALKRGASSSFDDETGVRVKRHDPGDGSVVERSPTDLRVWFDRSPDPAESRVTLEGAAGEFRLEGLHTMGYQDLMVRIVGRIPDGDYVARWYFVGLEGVAAEGEWHFTVERGD